MYYIEVGLILLRIKYTHKAAGTCIAKGKNSVQKIWKVFYLNEKQISTADTLVKFTFNAYGIYVLN